MTGITVRSHVGRDLLQSAEHFKTDHAVVWEYVANSLQYHSPATPPVVRVSIDERRRLIRVTDNGRGMSHGDLSHFFTMHGENLERASGRIGRGLFGTGKSAAFAIADTLRVTSVKDGRRATAVLTREQIESARDGRNVPVDLKEVDVETSEPNGTEIEISRVRLKKIDRGGITRYIEQHLAHYPRDVEVYIDHYLCAFKQPEVAETCTFTPGERERAFLGNVVLTINVSRGPLDDELRGIQIFSHGNWHETTLAGCDGKEMAEYIFGEVDVPAIESYEGPDRPFDNTRSGRLNPSNEIVQALYRLIGSSVDHVRRGLVARERERARSEESKRLEQQATRIAEILSGDFAEFQRTVARAQAASRGRDVGPRFVDGATTGDSAWVEGGSDPAEPIPRVRKRGEPRDDPAPTAEPPEFESPVASNPDGSTVGKPSGVSGTARSPRGGFSIRYEYAGKGEPRGKYVADRRTIVINLDHPQVAAVYAVGGSNSDSFLRLAVEVAITEYAISLAQELIEQYGVVDEALYDIRETIDRVSRRMLGLLAGK